MVADGSTAMTLKIVGQMSASSSSACKRVGAGAGDSMGTAKFRIRRLYPLGSSGQRPLASRKACSSARGGRPPFRPHVACTRHRANQRQRIDTFPEIFARARFLQVDVQNVGNVRALFSPAHPDEKELKRRRSNHCVREIDDGERCAGLPWMKVWSGRMSLCRRPIFWTRVLRDAVSKTGSPSRPPNTPSAHGHRPPRSMIRPHSPRMTRQAAGEYE